MALALYRKYRPRTFTEVIGQEHVTEPLMQALRTGRLHHAYLFSGPRGCGKTSSARILARSLNCLKGPTPEPCGECESCVALAPDGPGSIDVIEIDAASHGGVDDARDLRERAFFAPVASRFKVYVIDEAHMVSTQGFNALLKLVEEPPEYVKFVFATTEPEKVLGTIRSRTHHYPFRLIPPGVLRPYLEMLCREEGVAVEPAVFPLVVRAGAGSVRDSLSVLDQLISGAGESGVAYARAVNLLGVTDVALLDDMTDALAAGDGAAAFQTIERVVDAGHDPRRYAADLLERLRDLIVLQQVPDAAASGIIEAPGDQLERMAAQADRMGPATVSRLADIAHNGLTEMRGTTAPRLVLELIIARMLLPGADDAHGALLHRLERMERRLGAATPTPPDGGPPDDATADTPGAAAQRPARPSPSAAAQSAAPTAAAPQPSTPRSSPPSSAPRPSPPSSAPRAAAPRAPTSRSGQDQAGDDRDAGTEQAPPPPAAADRSALPGSPGTLDAAAVRRVWDEVLTVLRRRSQRAAALAREAIVRDVHGDEIVLVFQHLAHANMFSSWADLLIEAVHEVLGGVWTVRAELGGDQNPRGGATGQPSLLGPSAGEESPRTEPAGPPVKTGDWPAPAQLGGWQDIGPDAAAQQSAAARADRTPPRSNRASDRGAEPGRQAARGPAEPPAGRAPAAKRGATKERPAGGTKASRTKADTTDTTDTTGTTGTTGAAGRARQVAQPTGAGPVGGPEWEEPTPDEPPFDPDHDAAPGPQLGRRLEGFDPGDEPLDDAVDPAIARQSSHEQAARLLSEQLGAEPYEDPRARG